MNCTAEKQLSHGVFESFEIRKDSFFTVPQCEDTAPIQIGEILNNTYLITRFIAQGGMGIVYEGIDLVLHRKVAIKVLVTDFDDEEYEKELKLFQTEINLCGNLRHPNVIQIYYSGIHHRLPYLVMEYIEGIPINEYVMKQRRFNWNQKVKLISQVASGLAYIHKNNILHRDIKPSNILVKADGTPVLIDFGISIKKNLATVATNEGELSGTIHYMSPEQVAGEYDKINERSDIYSLGLILYELLIKRPAYTGSPNEIIGQIFNSSLLPPSDVNINISETLSNITMKAIAKEPEDRYSTATEFIEDLRLYLKSGNNQRVVKTVSLSEKVSYYLKPNRKIAVALGCIMIFFMAILCICACNNGSSLEDKKTVDEKQSRRDNHKSDNDEVPELVAKEDQESQHEHEQIENIPPVPPVPPIPIIPGTGDITTENTENKKSQQKKTNPEDVDTIADTAPVKEDTTEPTKGTVTYNPGSSKPVSPNVEKPVKPVKPSPDDDENDSSSDDDENNEYSSGSKKNLNRNPLCLMWSLPKELILQASVFQEESPLQNNEKFTVEKKPYSIIENNPSDSKDSKKYGEREFLVYNKKINKGDEEFISFRMEFNLITKNDQVVRDRQRDYFYKNIWDKKRWDKMASQNGESSSVLLACEYVSKSLWGLVMNTEPLEDSNMPDDDDDVCYTEEEKQQFLKKLSFPYQGQSDRARTISPHCFPLWLLDELSAKESEESPEDTEKVHHIIIIPKDNNDKSNEEQILATELFEKSDPIKIKGRKYPVFIHCDMKFILVEEDNPTEFSFLIACKRCGEEKFQSDMYPESWQVLSVSDFEENSEDYFDIASEDYSNSVTFLPIVIIPKDANKSWENQLIDSGMVTKLSESDSDKKYRFTNKDIKSHMEVYFDMKFSLEDNGDSAYFIGEQCDQPHWLAIMNLSNELWKQDYLNSKSSGMANGRFHPIVMIPYETSPIKSMTNLEEAILNTGKFVEVPSIEDSASEVFVHARTGIGFTIKTTTTGVPFLCACNENEWRGQAAKEASNMILEDCNFCTGADLSNPYNYDLYFHGSTITLYK